MRVLRLLRHTLVISAVLFAGCGSNSATPAPTCDPVCRDGFVCSRGTCVSACNPACRSTEVCVPSGASFTCATLPTDGSTPTDASADVQTPPGDAPVPMDLPPGMDVPAPPGDTAMPPSDGAPPPPDATPTDTGRVPCGAPGQGCCFMRACSSGSECVMGTCRAYTRAMNECSRPAECTTGQVCAGPSECTGHGCWTCGMARGTGAMGSVCTSSEMCATGVCRFGRCTVPCTVGGAGDTECRTVLGANQVCTELTYSTAMGASLVTLGVCAPSCARNGDCTAPALCVPFLNFLNDRYDFVCNTIQPGSIRTGIAGTPCTDGNTCQSALCIPPGMGTGPGACTAFCVTAADCPPGAPVCADLPLLRPSGGTQIVRGCFTR